MAEEGRPLAGTKAVAGALGAPGVKKAARAGGGGEAVLLLPPLLVEGRCTVFHFLFRVSIVGCVDWLQ